MIVLLMVVATSTASFAKGSNDNVQTAAKDVVQKVKDAPSGTTYGVVEVTKSHIVVNTPLAVTTSTRMKTEASFMGITAKLIAAKERRVQGEDLASVRSVNTRKATVTKQ